MIDETTSENTGTEPETIITEPSQTPIEQELERENNKGGRTEAEKAAYSLKKNAERAKELGVDPAEVLGMNKTESDDDEVPAWYKRLENKESAKTALELADNIDDPKERELVKVKLETVITSGTPEERLRVARGYVNSVKNGQIAEEMGRATAARTYISGSGAPANQQTREPELTSDEQQFAKLKGTDGKPLMTPAEIIATRTPQQ